MVVTYMCWIVFLLLWHCHDTDDPSSPKSYRCTHTIMDRYVCRDMIRDTLWRGRCGPQTRCANMKFIIDRSIDLGCLTHAIPWFESCSARIVRRWHPIQYPTKAEKLRAQWLSQTVAPRATLWSTRHQIDYGLWRWLNKQCQHSAWGALSGHCRTLSPWILRI